MLDTSGSMDTELLERGSARWRRTPPCGTVPAFPPDGPILLITDGACDHVRVRREHAFLVPAGARLPFTPKGPVFRVR